MSTKSKQYDPDLKARAALAVHKNEEVIFELSPSVGGTPGLDHRMEMRVAGICAVSNVYLAKTKLGTNALGCAQYLPSGNLQTCRTSALSWQFGIPDNSESTASFQKDTHLPNKKAGSPFQATRLSFSRSAAFRPYLTMGLAFTEYVTHTMKKLKVNGIFMVFEVLRCFVWQIRTKNHLNNMLSYA